MYKSVTSGSIIQIQIRVARRVDADLLNSGNRHLEDISTISLYLSKPNDMAVYIDEVGDMSESTISLSPITVTNWSLSANPKIGPEYSPATRICSDL